MNEQTILLVEDDPIQRRQFARLLGSEGYRVLQASTGVETIRILECERIHLVLTDRKMPGPEDGDWLLGYVRANYPHIPVALVTAHPDELSDHKPDGLLCKPFAGAQLRELARRLTQQPPS